MRERRFHSRKKEYDGEIKLQMGKRKRMTKTFLLFFHLVAESTKTTSLLAVIIWLRE